jgi:acyl-CoA synthetase (AMP-forming)/AMP-acid ligase II
VPVDPRDAVTFPQLLRSAAAAYGDDLAVTLKADTIPDDQISFAELDRRSAELARGLIARGVGKGTRVGFIYGNSPSWVLMLSAISRIGAVAIPISTLIKANELVRVLRQSDVSGLILQRKLLGNDYVDRICKALPELADGDSPDLRIAKAPFLRWIASTGDGLPPAIRPMSWFSDAAASVSEDLLAEIESEVHPTDQMVEIYTSGSMALPKGVKHSHGPVLYRANYVRRMQKFERGQQIPTTLPMFWVGGLMMTLTPSMTAGATSTCTEGTSTNSRMAMGSVLSADDMKNYTGMSVCWALGMTETLGPYAYGDVLRVPGYPLCSPLDHIAERYEVKIADPNGVPVKDGEVGEVLVRGYALTSGLHKVERSQFFDDDGFFHTGDRGLVEGSRVHFLGRFGEMIKTAGSNVSPTEVEMEMQQLEGIHNAYVVGLPDDKRGQLVAAAVVARDGVKLDFADIEAKLRERLSSYKVPRAYVQIAREEVPMLHSNKVSKRMVEQLLIEKLGRG